MKRVALVTGGTRGIGLGIARVLASLGFDLALNGVRDESQVNTVVTELRQTGCNVLYCRGDISLVTDRNNIVNSVKNHFGKLHVLVNNAGVAPIERMDILDATEESFERVVSINLKGPYFLTQQVARWMIDQKISDASFAGCIITVSSISATVASVNRGEYCISKAGLGMVTKLFATRLGEYNIPVYEIRPGVIDTDMTSGAKEKYDKLIGQGICLQARWGTPEDVGKAVGALASNQLPYSTGQVILVDGGMSVGRL